MSKILVVGNGDSVFVKDFIRQYNKNNTVVDLISYGQESRIEGVRYQYSLGVPLNYKLSSQLSVFLNFRKALNEIENNYDAIVLHFIYSNLAPHIYFLRKKSKKVISVIWGSDFYRVSSKLKIFLQDIIYKNSDIIVFTNPKTKKKFQEVKKNIKADRAVARFGLPALDEIEKLSNIDSHILCNNFKLPNDKIKIMVGYNSSLAHEQILIINQVCNFSEDLLNKIHLVFPLGYGDKSNRSLIEKALENNKNIRYTILDKFYDFQEVAKLRKVTDILINIQSTDQFSGSMQETLYAGGWVLTGSWLPYEKLFALEPKILTINNKIEVGEKLKILIEKNVKNSQENTEKIKNYIVNESSWEKNIPIWNEIIFNKPVV